MKRETPHLSKRNWGFSKLGNCTCLWVNGRIFLTIGPDWQFNVCIGSIILTVMILFYYVMAPKTATELQLLGFVILLTNFTSYCLTALLNPGIILSPSSKPSGSKQTYCQNCEMFVEQTSEHCGDCDLCIMELDHHCPLSGKCIAKGNICAFYTFLISIFCVFFYFVVWILATLPRKRDIN